MSDEIIEKENRIFGRNKLFLLVTLAVIFMIGAGIRLFDLTDAPLDFHPTRQLHSALMARGMYYQHVDDAPEWQRELAVRQWKAEGLIEPPFMEWITAQTYRIIGDDPLWVARVYSILFWMAGSIGLFLVAKELAGTDGAVVGMLYYLVLPYAAIASRAFQPDPLMTATIVWAAWAIVRWQRTPTWGRAITAGLLGGLAILVKSVAVFFIAGAWLGIIFFGVGLFKAIRSRMVWVAAVLSVLPYALFHIYGVYISGLLVGQFSLRFFPQLWLDPTWYLRWNGEIASVIGFEWFILALLSTLSISKPAHRAMLAGLWIGYFVYGLTLPHHISTHDYYTLPLVPVAALGLAAGAGLLFRNFKGPYLLRAGLVVGVLLFVTTIKAWDVVVTLKRSSYTGEIAIWQELGEKIGHDTPIIALTHDYGYRLAYWGWLTPTNWMTSGDFSYRELAGQEFNDMQALFDEQAGGKDYFLVTMFGELESQPALKNILYQNYPIADESGDYILFNLRNPEP